MNLAALAAAAAIAVSSQPALNGADPRLAMLTPPPAGPPAAKPSETAEISVLTYNVKGLPWPIAFGRAKALREIGEELAQMRREGRQPDVVLIQEGFRGEIADLVTASGYRYWAQGPSRSERNAAPPPEGSRGFKAVRYWLRGEGWGKFAGSGLHVLSDLPISRVESVVYHYCAGLDCLANKGAMLATLTLPDGVQVDVVNTHMNCKRKALAPMKRTLVAHNLQTDDLFDFIARKWTGDRPLLVGGDFNVKNAPDRYNYRAAARPYTVVSEYCGASGAGCRGEAPPAAARPWLRTQDLQAFKSGGPAEIRPMFVETLFAGPDTGGLLSDHDAYLVRYQIRMTRTPVRPAEPAVQLAGLPH